MRKRESEVRVRATRDNDLTQDTKKDLSILFDLCSNFYFIYVFIGEVFIYLFK